MIQPPPKLFFSPPYPLNTPEFSVRGVGFKERMGAGIVDRPQGTKDYLFMYFYKPVSLCVDKQIIQSAAPCLMVWDPEHGHYYGRSDRAWLHSWCHCHGKLPERELHTLNIPLNRPIYGLDTEVFERFIIELHHEIRAHHQPDSEIVYTLFHLFLRKLWRTAQPKEKLVPESILRARNQIESLFHSNIELSSLAKTSGYSIPHFSCLFHKFFGCSPIQYVIRLRLQRAQLLLGIKNMKMESIADECGFYDVYSFSKLFKKHHGISPSKWRSNQLPMAS